MTLGLYAYFAIKRAMMDARRELTGQDDWLAMDVPATCQRIQMNCGVTTESLGLVSNGVPAKASPLILEMPATAAGAPTARI